ncbi:MAG: TonB-dependent receptor [Bacteroidales bacterium]|nr:TonB-dependent receptor [Bacteroidales bacterium]
MYKTFKCLIIILIFSAKIFAQSDTIWIDELEVSAYRVPTTYSETSRVVLIITKEELDNFPANSIQEVLEYTLNVDARQRGNNGVQADISIRGGSCEQTLILLNGVKINDPQTGHHNLNIPVALEDVERIEILEGPGSRIFGPNSFSGAINIITGTKKDRNLKLSLSGGENEFYNISTGITYKFGNIKNHLSLSKKSSKGYIENTDFDISNIFYQGIITSQSGKLDLQAGYLNKKFGANSFYTPKYPNQFEHIKSKFVSVGYSTDGKIRFTPNIYWKRNHDKFELFRDNPASWYNSHNYHLTDVYGIDLNASINSKIGSSAIGADFYTEKILSNILGNPMNDTISVPGEPEGFFTHSKERQNINLFMEQSIFINKFSFSAGFLLNYNSDYLWNINPGIDISYKFSNKLKLFGSVNQSLRFPTFTDLYYVGPTNIGNPDLKPEKAITYETGIKFLNDFLRTHFSFFRRNGKNIIDWVKLQDTLKWESKNITELITNGFELSFNLSFEKLYKKDIFIKSIMLGYAYMNTEKQSGNYISKYALDYLRHKISITLQHSIYWNIGASWSFTFQDRDGTYYDYNLQKEVDYNPFMLCDTRIYWKKNFVSIYFEASNLFNTKYIDFANIEMPGRWVKGGIIFDMDIKKRNK